MRLDAQTHIGIALIQVVPANQAGQKGVVASGLQVQEMSREMFFNLSASRSFIHSLRFTGHEGSIMETANELNETKGIRSK